ncbi:MAG: imidazole glycerol phosphate synthase subunit HisH [Oscillospiraceae bacterium]|nr:imidazole glycerol phosphate synthase subunit HisH [Oscillospiraceae bacterium]
MKITVIDYGLSNLLSVQRGFEHFGAEVEITGEHDKILEAKALVLPGVGAFKDGMAGLSALELTPIIRKKAIEGVPLLGICLGMQMLFDESDEFGVHKGLGLLPGRVELIPQTDALGQRQHVPHIGWNNLYPGGGRNNFDGTILQEVADGAQAYFVHSYEAKPQNPQNRLADTIYGGRKVCAAALNGNVMGCQFHPEKSGEVGLKIIKQFIVLAKAFF